MLQSTTTFNARPVRSRQAKSVWTGLRQPIVFSRLRQFNALSGALVVLFSLGCGSARLAPRLSPTELDEVAALEQAASWPEITVGVVSPQFPAHEESLILALRATDLFTRVELLTALDETAPDLVAVIRKPVCGDAVIPLFTFLSFGFVPTIVDDTEGYRFDLVPPDQYDAAEASASRAPKRGLTVEYVQETKVIIGWLGLALSPSPNWTIRSTRRHPRSFDRLRMQLLRQQSAILALLESPSPSS